MSAQTYTGTLKIIECASCHMDFGITPEFQRARKNDHKNFVCPSGCTNYYPAKSEEEKLRDRLAAREHRLEQAHARYRDLTSAQTWKLRLAHEDAKSFRHSKAQLGAFWKGYEFRGCDPLPTDCPYDDNRGGFRRAWFAGAGMEFEGAGCD